MPETKNVILVGEIVGNYRILGVAGAGGMGVVYKALDLKLQRVVALKFLPFDLNVSEKEKDRFLKEARTASSLDHPNIGVIHGVEDTPDGRAFIVMGFYEGESLAQKIRSGYLPLHEALDIAVQMARGLAEAHRRDIVHRDVKPSNVMLTEQGLVKIVDFGLARIVSAQSATQTGGTTGTVGYMSPEQTLGKPVDQRTDIWALGVSFAEMVTGQNPFWRESVPSIVVAILNEPPRAMDGVPLELQQIVYRALSKDPNKRYQSCGEMLSDLEMARSHFLGLATSVNASALTESIRPIEFQKYVDEASHSAWVPATVAERNKRKMTAWLVGGVIAIVTLMGLLLVGPIRKRLQGGSLVESEKHIAVLPFDNSGNDPANEALAQGLMDSLSGKLSNLDVGNQSLWVVPATEVRRHKVIDPSEALRELGATLVVKGNIQREGQDVHLTVNLIDTQNLRQIGSVALEDRAGDLATLQDEAVARLARLMHISVTAEMLRNTGGNVTPAAYEDYLKALGFMQRYDKPGNLDLAIGELENAVKTDPRFALGYAQLGEAYRLKYKLETNPKWLDEALANCRKAAELDDHLPAVYVTLARIHDVTGKHDLALQEFQQALKLNPRNAEALGGIAYTYENSGHLQDAEAAFIKAAALRPDYWDGYDELGLFYDRQQKYSQAIEQLRHAVELTPDNAQAYSNLGAVYVDTGDSKMLPDAEQALKKSIGLSPTYAAYANLASLYYHEKRFTESAGMWEKALRLNEKDYLVWGYLANTYEWLNQFDKADAARERKLALLEQGVKLKPQDAGAQANLAAIYAKKKLREKALIRIQAALALSPDDPVVLEDVGAAYEELGDRAQALQYIERSLQKGNSLDQLNDDPDLQDLLRDKNFRVTGK